LVQNRDIGSIFYSDLPLEEQQRWLKLLVKHPRALAFYSPKNISYTEIDTVFIYCEKDAQNLYSSSKHTTGAVLARPKPAREKKHCEQGIGRVGGVAYRLIMPAARASVGRTSGRRHGKAAAWWRW